MDYKINYLPQLSPQQLFDRPIPSRQSLALAVLMEKEFNTQKALIKLNFHLWPFIFQKKESDPPSHHGNVRAAWKKSCIYWNESYQGQSKTRYKNPDSTKIWI